MTVAIKVCGVTRPEDAAAAAALGVDFIGLNFWPQSRRVIEAAAAPAAAVAAKAARADVSIVGVFVDASADEIAEWMAAVPLDVVQLHGAETIDFTVRLAARLQRPVWKAIPVTATAAELMAWPASVIVLDTPSQCRGGSGQVGDWPLAAELVRCSSRPVLLAGGLNPDNVGAAMQAVRPWGVDVASGVESAPGVKSRSRMAEFVRAVRGSEA
jgi:phosphoribosylanthranilate isomerase